MCGSWLKTDEHALAGGLAAKLSEAESRAIRLLTPPKHETPTASSTPATRARLEGRRDRQEGPADRGGVGGDR